MTNLMIANVSYLSANRLLFLLIPILGAIEFGYIQPWVIICPEFDPYML